MENLFNRQIAEENFENIPHGGTKKNPIERQVGKDFDAENRSSLKRIKRFCVRPKLHPKILWSPLVEMNWNKPGKWKTIGTIDETVKFNWPNKSGRIAGKSCDYFLWKSLDSIFWELPRMRLTNLGPFFLFQFEVEIAIKIQKWLSPLESSPKSGESLKGNPIGNQHFAQVEGFNFVQIFIGWSWEYMRGIYWPKMPDFAGWNSLDMSGKLPNGFGLGRQKKMPEHLDTQSYRSKPMHRP